MTSFGCMVIVGLGQPHLGFSYHSQAQLYSVAWIEGEIKHEGQIDFS